MANMTAHEFIPPTRQGVSASKVFLPTMHGKPPETTFAYLCAHFPHILASEWQQRFDDGLIIDAQGQTLSVASPYLSNQHIFYYRFLSHEVAVPFQHEILFENEHLLVVDKPHFLTMTPTGKYVQETLLVRLKQSGQTPDLTPIHRLDRETAGVVMFCKKPESRGVYQSLFAARDVQKTYHAIAPYHHTLQFPRTVRLNMSKGEPFYTMKVNPDAEPNSETWIECLEYSNHWAKYRLSPKTGKQHQLRVHLAHLGLAIQNDPLYPFLAHKADDDFSTPLQLLAKELQFVDPITQTEMYFCSRQSLSLSFDRNDNHAIF